MPELGSKISLISKADIRYEGRLFTVDPQECTIALANVRSFGTEDRDTQFPVAPQNQVYEYILFRGTDIKDIRVVNAVSALPNDPAIVQMTVPPSMSQQPYQQQPGYGHPVMNQMAAMNNQYGQPYGISMSAIAPMINMSSQNRQPTSKPTSVLDIISGGSRSTTPTSIITRKSPTMDQGIQVGQQHQQKLHQGGKGNDKQNVRNVQGSHRERDGMTTGRPNSGLSQYPEGKRDLKDIQLQHQVANHMHGASMRGGRANWVNARGNIRGRGGRGRGHFRMNQPPNVGGKAKNRLKFDNDYDFEQANTEFEELRLQLMKTKIDSGSENEKKDDSGNETGAGDGEPEEDSEVIHYDKSKSFFDNISCEAVERSKGRSQRTDWRTERKLNSETFGVASMRRGNFRGRGYYPRNSGVYRGNNAISSGGAQNQGFRGTFRGTRTHSRKINNQVVTGSHTHIRISESQHQPQHQQNKRLISSNA